MSMEPGATVGRTDATAGRSEASAESPGARVTARFAPVILAGGSGTRFWPRSRKTRAKQVLALDGERTMIQQTLDRLAPIGGASAVWVITNDHLVAMIVEQLPGVTAAQILSEPVARNTAPACALAAFLLERDAPETVIGIFPSDHAVKDAERFAAVVRAGAALAASGRRIVVLGVPPTRPETGYGYIEQGELVAEQDPVFAEIPVRRVRRFTEKPTREVAEQFLASGDYAWNSGMFLWSARTLTALVREHQPGIATHLEAIAAAHGTPAFVQVFAELYPGCASISIDYAVLEPQSAKGEEASEIYALPADFGWNDLGSWDALYEHKSANDEGEDGNVVEALGQIAIEARGNYVYAPGKTISLLGVSNLVVVETEDALLITTRDRSQDVGKLTRALAEMGQHDLI